MTAKCPKCEKLVSELEIEGFPGKTGGPNTSKWGMPSTMPENPVTVAFKIDATATRLWIKLWRSWGPMTPSGNFTQRAVVGLDSQIQSRERLYKDIDGYL
jgi:hypothetical protein